jgi:fused signal recognition particle receptor
MESLLSSLQPIYTMLDIERAFNLGDLFGLLSFVFVLGASVARLFSSGSTALIEAPPTPVEKVEQPVEVAKPKLTVPSFAQRLSLGLARSRQDIWGKLGQLLSGKNLDQQTLDQIEELLYGADLGPKMVQEVLESLESNQQKEQEFKTYLFEYFEKKMSPVQENQATSLYSVQKNTGAGPRVIMIVGVNGAGKTTTIGKLATKLTRDGAKVVVGACDTFRAAAVDQLQVWCERAGAQMIRAKEGANPSGVGFEALQTAIQQNADYCLLDTAGRLHTKENLMDELKKSKNVLSKLMPDAPHEVLLVLDAITGQNALRQAQEFHKTLNLTGLIFTKCDGSSKAGSAIGIVDELQVPLAFIGIGESVDDLDKFDLQTYLKALVDYDPELASLT